MKPKDFFVSLLTLLRILILLSFESKIMNDKLLFTSCLILIFIPALIRPSAAFVSKISNTVGPVSKLIVMVECADIDNENSDPFSTIPYDYKSIILHANIDEILMDK